MSMPYSVITCNACDKHWSTTSTWHIYCYSLPDGRTTRADCSLSWCHSCNEFRPVERIPTKDAVAKALAAKIEELAVLRKRPLEKLRRLLSWGNILRKISQETAWAIKDLEKAQAAYDWRALRESPPKCLECGSTNTQDIDISKWERSGSTMSHPRCTGQLSIEDSGIRIALVHQKYCYDVEGNFL